VESPKIVAETSMPWESFETTLRNSEDAVRIDRERLFGDRRAHLPKTGRSQQAVECQLDELQAGDPSGAHGRLTVFALKGDQAVQQMVESAYGKFLSYNALFAPYLPSLRIMERDVLDMGIALLGGGDSSAANLTLGGSESIYCGLHAAREWARITKPKIQYPEFIVPWSAHAAFSKGAHLLGIKLVRVGVGPDFRADLGAMANAVNADTIGLAGSAPCWGYGLFDDIPGLGRLALQRDLWLHVDACVGGFLAPFVALSGRKVPPFDLRVSGVRSLSADLHKYGYAAKPLSMILWSDRDLQRYHYQVVMSWPNGPYVSESLLGSRPAGSLASAWAVMNFLGEDGYVRLAARTMAVKEQLATGIRALEVFDIWDNELSLLVFGSTTVDVQQITADLKMKGWFMMGTAQPPLIHLTVDPVEDDIVDSFLTELSVTTSDVRKGLVTESAALAYI
jgi:sphinganine-1-phosphate aldolase